MRVATESVTLRFPKVPTKGRPRFFGGHAYTDKQTAANERAIRDAWHAAAGDRWSGWQGEARVFVTVRLSLAKSAPKRLVGTPNLKTPDADNVLKLCLDALNGLAYADDRQLTFVSVKKEPMLPRGEFGEDRCELTVSVDYWEER